MTNTRRAALVTGAAGGIGRAAAIALAEAGFDLALNDLRDSDALRATIAAITAIGARAIEATGDIADFDVHESILDTVAEGLGDLHCLVNNAGVSVLRRGDLLDVSLDSYNRCLDTNTRGSFFLTQAAARRMVASRSAADGRSIVFVTSVNAQAASIQRGEYCMSKAALSMAARLFALRLAEEQIGVYEVQPGLIETDMSAPSKTRYDALIADGLTAIRRWGQPDDVAKVVVAAATGRLPYTVGQALQVDGGLLVSKF